MYAKFLIHPQEETGSGLWHHSHMQLVYRNTLKIAKASMRSPIARQLHQMSVTIRTMQNSMLLGLDFPHVWDIDRALEHLQALGQTETKRTAERRLNSLSILPSELNVAEIEDEIGHKPVSQVLSSQVQQARGKRKRVLFARLHAMPRGQQCLYANDARGARYGLPLGTAEAPGPARVATALHPLVGRDLAVFLHARLVARGKDSTVMLQLARKAFYPQGPPLLLLRVDTRWKFQQMVQSRDQMVCESGMEWVVHINPEADAESLSDVILELANARSSERQGRAIDSDAPASAETKKQEGYF